MLKAPLELCEKVDAKRPAVICRLIQPKVLAALPGMRSGAGAVDPAADTETDEAAAEIDERLDHGLGGERADAGSREAPRPQFLPLVVVAFLVVALVLYLLRR